MSEIKSLVVHNLGLVLSPQASEAFWANYILQVNSIISIIYIDICYNNN